MISTVKDDYKKKVLSTALGCVAVAFGITEEEIKSESRKEDVVHARHAYCALVVMEFNDPIPDDEKYRKVKFSDIGGYVNRDHASAMYGARRSHVNNMEGQDSKYIPKYFKARKMFLEGMDIMGRSGIRTRLAEINIEIAKLDIEKSKLLNYKNKKHV